MDVLAELLVFARSLGPSVLMAVERAVEAFRARPQLKGPPPESEQEAKEKAAAEAIREKFS